MIFGKPDPKNTSVKPTKQDPPMPSAAALPDPKNTSVKPTKQDPPMPSAAPLPVASTAPASTPAQRDRKPATIRYVDRPDITETFADAVTGVIFDGQTLRLEFAVTRLDEVKLNTAISGRRYPACRVVLPPAAAIDLINRMQQVAAALTQAGMARATPRSGDTSKAG